MPIRPLYDVTDEIGGDRSKGRPRFAIRLPLRPIVHLSPFPRYSALKFDRKRFRQDDDVIRRSRRRHSIEGHRVSIGCPLTRNVYLASLRRYGGRKIFPLREIGQSRKTTELPFDPYMTSQTKSEVTVRKADRGFLFARR